MPALTIKSFGGIAPVVPPRYLQDSQAQVALNCPMWNGSLQPLAGTGSSIYSLTKSGTPQTIYRFGQDTVSDTAYWFHWTKDVDVCRGQIAGDVSEWTFFTGDGGPKATYNALALSPGDYPSVSRPLGLPTPTAAATAFGNAFSADEHPAEIYLTASHISQLSTSYGILISSTTDDAAEYTTVSLTGAITAASVAAAINSALSATVTATVESSSVKVATTTAGLSAALFVKFQTGTQTDADGTFVPAADPNLTATGAANTDAFLVVTDAEIGSISSGDTIAVTTDTDEVFSSDATSTLTATTFAAFVTSRAGSKVTATVYGSSVVLTPGTEGAGADGFLQYVRSNGDDVITDIKETGSEEASPARIIVTQSHIDSVEGAYIELAVNTSEPVYVSIPATAYVSTLSSLRAYGVNVTTYGSIEPFAVVDTAAIGTSATLSIRGGNYPSEPVFSLQSAEGYVDEDETTETRVYTWTWVNKESGFEFESGPAPASNSVEVRTGQAVSLSGLAPVPTGEYVVTNRRVYRSTNGVFLFVAEIPAASSAYTDTVATEDLAEELPTLNWAEPPQSLRNLINLPNGMMAGSVGRDIYFCEPYRPHAWPENYIQTLDYPVVGLGRMDTTLAVLTTGTPYFVQGTHPAATAVVKSDLEQACVSKRSIVSHGGAVFYAAPDGLMMLSPGGSRIVTDKLFSFAQWQAFFKPESIHAYQQDNQYIGFYDNGAQRGGFIYDMRSQNFILHDIYATAGFQDVQRDKLFLAFEDGSVRVWAAGAVKTFTWRSKKFTMPKPLSFGWAQLEAEAYPMTLKIIADGATVREHTVTSRDPFRLPAQGGRDYEMEVSGEHEVFSIAVAHSASELRDG